MGAAAGAAAAVTDAADADARAAGTTGTAGAATQATIGLPLGRCGQLPAQHSEPLQLPMPVRGVCRGLRQPNALHGLRLDVGRTLRWILPCAVPGGAHGHTTR